MKKNGTSLVVPPPPMNTSSVPSMSASVQPRGWTQDPAGSVVPQDPAGTVVSQYPGQGQQTVTKTVAGAPTTVLGGNGWQTSTVPQATATANNCRTTQAPYCDTQCVNGPGPGQKQGEQGNDFYYNTCGTNGETTIGCSSKYGSGSTSWYPWTTKVSAPTSVPGNGNGDGCNGQGNGQGGNWQGQPQTQSGGSWRGRSNVGGSVFNAVAGVAGFAGRVMGNGQPQRQLPRGSLPEGGVTVSMTPPTQPKNQTADARRLESKRSTSSLRSLNGTTPAIPPPLNARNGAGSSNSSAPFVGPQTAAQGGNTSRKNKKKRTKKPADPSAIPTVPGASNVKKALLIGTMTAVSGMSGAPPAARATPSTTRVPQMRVY